MFNDPRDKNKYYVRLIIKGFDEDPNEISKQLDISPTETNKKGEYRDIGGIKPLKLLNKINSWTLKSTLPVSSSVEEQLEYLIKLITPQRDTLIRLASKYEIEFICSIYYYEANPGFSLGRELLGEISALGADISFDIYNLAGTLLTLEDKKNVEHLESHLSDVNFIYQEGRKNKEDLKTLLNSLSALEKAAYTIHSQSIPDLIWNERPEDRDFLEVFVRLSEELKAIEKNIKSSKFLTNLVKVSH